MCANIRLVLQTQLKGCLCDDEMVSILYCLETNYVCNVMCVCVCVSVW